MKRVWKGSLSLSLGLLVSGAQAGEPPWRAAGSALPAAAQVAEAVTIGPPVAVIGRPVPQAPRMLDPGVQQTSFNSAPLTPLQLVVRSDGQDPPKPMPAGAPKSDPPEFKLPQPKLEPEAIPAPHDSQPAPAPTIVHTPGTPIQGCGPDCNTKCDCHDGTSLWGCDSGCWDRGRFYFSAEYLLWFIPKANLPPLITADNEALAAMNGFRPGALNSPTATVLFGGKGVNDDPRSGARFTAGWWLTPEHCLGTETSVFFLGQRGVNFTAGSPGSPFIGRPFLDTNPQSIEGVPLSGPNAQPVANNTGLSGTVSASLSNRLWGLEQNLRTNLCCGCWYSVDLLAGFRYLSFDEGLVIRENLVQQPTVDLATNTVFPLTAINVSDEFGVRNRFYGGQVGSTFKMRWARWGVDLTGKIALGSTHQTAEIEGFTRTTSAATATALGSQTVTANGLLAQPTNSGHFSRDMFSVVPELGVNLSYQVTDYMRLFAGYNFLYWSNVARAGQQIDTSVNTSQIPNSPSNGLLTGPANPAFAFKGSGFWAHGANFGIEFRY